MGVSIWCSVTQALVMVSIWLLMSDYIGFFERPAWPAACGLLWREYDDEKRYDEDTWNLHQKMWEEG